MATTPSQPQQGGSSTPSQQQQGQQAAGLPQQAGSSQQAGQPVFRDWAAI